MDLRRVRSAAMEDPAFALWIGVIVSVSGLFFLPLLDKTGLIAHYTIIAIGLTILAIIDTRSNYLKGGERDV